MLGEPVVQPALRDGVAIWRPVPWADTAWLLAQHRYAMRPGSRCKFGLGNSLNFSQYIFAME